MVPHLYNTRRWGVPTDDMPRLLAMDAACAELPAFRRALKSDRLLGLYQGRDQLP